MPQFLAAIGIGGGAAAGATAGTVGGAGATLGTAGLTGAGAGSGMITGSMLNSMAAGAAPAATAGALPTFTASQLPAATAASPTMFQQLTSAGKGVLTHPATGGAATIAQMLDQPAPQVAPASVNKRPVQLSDRPPLRPNSGGGDLEALLALLRGRG